MSLGERQCHYECGTRESSSDRAPDDPRSVRLFSYFRGRGSGFTILKRYERDMPGKQRICEPR